MPSAWQVAHEVSVGCMDHGESEREKGAEQTRDGMWHTRPGWKQGETVLVLWPNLPAGLQNLRQHEAVNEYTAMQGDGTAHTLKGLLPGCTYRARVLAQNSAGVGRPSIPTDVVTSPTSPDPPTALAAVSRCALQGDHFLTAGARLYAFLEQNLRSVNS